MKTWSGSWDVKALIWSIKCNFYFMTTLPQAPFATLTVSICTATVLKKKAPWFHFFLFSFSHLTGWKRLGVMCDQDVWKSHSIFQLQLKLKGLTSAGAKWDSTPLFFSEHFFAPCFYFPRLPLLAATSYACMCTKTKALEGSCRCTDGTKLNWKSNWVKTN